MIHDSGFRIGFQLFGLTETRNTALRMLILLSMHGMEYCTIQVPAPNAADGESQSVSGKCELFIRARSTTSVAAAVFLLLAFLPLAIRAQYCTPDNRFTEAAVFTENQIDSTVNIVYGTAVNNAGLSEDLMLNIYYPSAEVETMSARPLIVLMHGGMFISGSRSNLTTACIEFAKRGYVAATIGYRLGWTFVPNCQMVTPAVVISSNRAIYRAIQDLHASMRYLVHHAASYSIDTAWIFAGGVSAGAFATADMAFITPEEFAQRWPYCNDPQFGEPLGYINSNGNDLTDSFSLKGLFHNWGSVIDNDYIRASTAIPMIGFAGELDELSPVDSGFFNGCPRYELMFGTRAIYQRLGGYGACSEITIKPHAGHGVYNTSYEQGIFRIGRASCFFKSLFCGSCSSLYTMDSIPPSCSLITTARNARHNEPLRIEPNPGKGKCTVLSTAGAGSLMRVYSLQGVNVFSQQLEANAQEVDLSMLATGVYIVEVNGERCRMVRVE